MKAGRKVIFSLFFASGVSGLIYQVVWLRMLSRIMGCTTYAIATVIAAFMGGLALGAFIFGKYVDRSQKPLLIYSMLELGIGIVAFFTPFLLQASLPLYKFVCQVSGQVSGLTIAVRVGILFVCILIPTTLMGGTLPVLTSYLVRKRKAFGENFSLLYGLNTLGAVVGVLLSGYVTIGLLGEWATVGIGIAINLLVAFIAWRAFKTEGFSPLLPVSPQKDRAADETLAVSPYLSPVRRAVLITFFISGFTALAYEVIWSRQLILFLKTSIYAFSMMLAIFLAGISLGSIFANKFVDRLKRPLTIFGSFEVIVGLISLINLYLVVALDKPGKGVHFFSGHDLMVALILIFPLACLFGLIYPVASRCYVKSLGRAGSFLGRLYAFNTVGSIAGALVAGFFFIGIWGSARSLMFLGIVNVVMGFILMEMEPGFPRRVKFSYILLLPLVFLLAWGLKGRDPFLEILANRVKRDSESYEIYFNREGIEGTVTSFIYTGKKHRKKRREKNQKKLWINGMGMTILVSETKLMAHLPLMLTVNPKKILVICFGMGTTVKSASIYDDLDITTVELVPEVYKCFGYYHPGAEDILKRDNVHPLVGDGRNFFLLTDEKYDVITIDPAPPIYSAGTVNLYTREFLTLCREHLTPDGVMCLWLPAAGLPIDMIMAFLKTFHSVFPDMVVWGSPRRMGIYLIGKLHPIVIDKERIKQAYTNPKMVEDLKEFIETERGSTRLLTSDQLLSLYMWDGNKVKKVSEKAAIISDNYPYTEFPFWRYTFGDRSRGMKRGKILVEKFK